MNKKRLILTNQLKQVYNHVRGLNPWPGAYTVYQDKVVKIWGGFNT